jgi:hypothetical protein
MKVDLYTVYDWWSGRENNGPSGYSANETVTLGPWKLCPFAAQAVAS